MNDAIEAFRKALSNDEACRRYIKAQSRDRQPKSALDVAMAQLQKAAGRKGIVLR